MLIYAPVSCVNTHPQLSKPSETLQEANFRVDKVSSQLESAGETAAISTVLELPLKDSCLISHGRSRRAQDPILWLDRSRGPSLHGQSATLPYIHIYIDELAI